MKYRVGDKVVRKLNGLIYTVNRIEEDVYIIVRHPSPCRPWFAYESEQNLTLSK